MNNKNSNDSWEVDEYGRRYRLIGNCREYETIIETTHGAFRQSDIDSGINVNTFEKPKEKYESVICPFSSNGKGYCKGEKCGIYENDKCVLSSSIAGNISELKPSKICPLRGRTICNENCALYNGKCGVISIIEQIKGKEI